jgi:hypothetical protein
LSARGLGADRACGRASRWSCFHVLLHRALITEARSLRQE